MKKVVAKTIEDETKEQKGKFLSMFLSTLGAILLGDLLADKGVIRTGKGATPTSWEWQAIRWRFLMSLHYLTNFKIQIYY